MSEERSGKYVSRNIYWPEAMYEQAKQLAKKEGMTLNGFVKQLVRDYIKQKGDN